MSLDTFEFMYKNYPALSDLMLSIADNAGEFGNERISATIAQYINENDAARLRQAVRELDQACVKLPRPHDELEDLMSYVLESEDEALALMRSLRDGLQAGLAAKLKAGEATDR